MSPLETFGGLGLSTLGGTDGFPSTKLRLVEPLDRGFVEGSEGLFSPSTKLHLVEPLGWGPGLQGGVVVSPSTKLVLVELLTWGFRLWQREGFSWTVTTLALAGGALCLNYYACRPIPCKFCISEPSIKPNKGR